jgi:ankyrin repeat protein
LSLRESQWSRPSFWKGHDDIVKLLLEKGAKVNATDEGERTALMSAAAQHHPRIVNLLLAKGADFNLATKKGATALDTALGEEGIKVIGLFGEKVFEASAEKDEPATIQALRRAGVRPVSRFFTATTFQEMENTLPQRTASFQHAREIRDFLFSLFANFKSIGFDDQQLTEARSRAVQAITKGRALIAYSSMTGDPKAERVQTELIDVAKGLLSDPQVERVYTSQHPAKP